MTDIAQRINWDTTPRGGKRYLYPTVKATESDNGKHLDLALSSLRHILSEKQTLDFPFIVVVSSKGNNLIYNIVLDEYISLNRVTTNYYRISNGEVVSDEEMEPLFEARRKRWDEEYKRKAEERVKYLMSRLQSADEQTLHLLFQDLIHGLDYHQTHVRRSATGDVLVEEAFKKIDSGVYTQ